MMDLTIPRDAEVEKVMKDTGMARMQAIRHLQQRYTLQRERPILTPRYGRK